MTAPGPFLVRETHGGGVHRLTPVGELDLVTAPQLESSFDVALASDDANIIVVDLSELSFMDSTGVHLLLRMRAASQDADRLRVIDGPRAVGLVLDITGARAYLPIISSDCDPLASPTTMPHQARHRT
jgi:anti-anti-sigma factor